MLRERAPGDGPPVVRILAGRLFADGASARADRIAASDLRQHLCDSEIGVPRPMGPLRNEPRLVLYDFHPWLDLGEYLAQRGASALPGAARRIGSLVAALHRSGGALAEELVDASVDPSCIHYGVDGRFSLDRFAGLSGRRPAMDSGAFLAGQVDQADPDPGPVDACTPAVGSSRC